MSTTRMDDLHYPEVSTDEWSRTMRSHLDSAPVTAFAADGEHPAFAAVPLSQARMVWGDDAVVSDGVNVWHVAPDGEMYSLMNPGPPVLVHRGTEALYYLVVFVARLAPGVVVPGRPDEPTALGAVVACTYGGRSCRAFRADDDAVSWVVAPVDGYGAYVVWLSWDELDNPVVLNVVDPR